MVDFLDRDPNKQSPEVSASLQNESVIAIAREEDAVLVAGSLYVVGSARTFLRRKL